MLLQPLGEAPTAKKEHPIPKTPLLKKNSSFATSSTRNLQMQAKPEPAKIATVNNFIQERKTVVKGLKPATVVASGSKTDRRP